MHRAHQELTQRAARMVDANLLLHPSVGMTKPGDVDHYTRVRCYEALVPEYPVGTATLSLLPLAMRMGGPREAVWHAIIRKNHGATHLIVGRDHAGPGRDSAGRHFYGPYDAQGLVVGLESELGIAAVPFQEMVYVAREARYRPLDEVPAGEEILSISGTEQRRLLREGRPLPGWFTPPAVAAELSRRYPPRSKQGVTVFFTGLPSAGKSTTGNVLLARLLEEGTRSVTLLDGDLVRRHLSSELGFSREHRDLNIRRVGFVASEVTRHGGLAICAAIAPYDSVRKDVRGMVEEHGGFVLVHMSTPIEVCEARDPKGMYARARSGAVQHFTGVSDPYEVPEDAEVVIDASRLGPEEAVEPVLAYLREQGYLTAEADTDLTGARLGD
jgi:sulfate adenylyltransferase